MAPQHHMRLPCPTSKNGPNEDIPDRLSAKGRTSAAGRSCPLAPTYPLTDPAVRPRTK
jgi:hypothetical protein